MNRKIDLIKKSIFYIAIVHLVIIYTLVFGEISMRIYYNYKYLKKIFIYDKYTDYRNHPNMNFKYGYKDNFLDFVTNSQGLKGKRELWTEVQRYFSYTRLR